jgi:hypothetical protein
VNRLSKSVVREIRTPRSVGTGGERSPPVTRCVETGATGELVRHRQTKGAATDMFGLKPPAPHSDSTSQRKARDEHMFSGMPPLGAGKRAVPALDLASL